MTSARELAQRLGLKRRGQEWRGRCPACDYPGALVLNEAQGKPLRWCANGCDRATLQAALADGVPAPSAAREPRSPGGAGADAADRTAIALRLWGAAKPARGTVAERYLASRGVVLPADGLRCLVDAKHPSGTRAPAMVALVADGASGQAVAVHRTWLRPDGTGKADLDPQRATLGPIAGGCVRLFPIPADGALAVAEGIESALAAAALLGVPAWASVSAGNLRDTLALPPAVRTITIAADHDAPGLTAARAAAVRWRTEGRAVRIATPDRPGQDFNDVLKAQADG